MTNGSLMGPDAAGIVCIGGTVAEIVAEGRGAGFRQPVRLQGPYPSGAPAILIDQVARLGHYPGTPDEQRRLRHASHSDRIRYYWPMPAAREAVDGLLAALHGVRIPETLISQHLPRLHGRVVAGAAPPDARALLIEAVRDVLRAYSRACRGARTP